MTTKGFTDELKATAAVAPLGVAANELLDSQMAKVGESVDQPLRMRAAFPTPDSKLYFNASKLSSGDNAAKIIPPIDDLLTESPAGSVDYQTAVTPVAGITLTREGQAYTHPSAAAVGQFVRVAFVRKADGSFDCKASDPAATVGALTNPGTLWSALDGLNMGYVDLECTAAGLYKTAGSATNVIENEVSGTARIHNIGAGGGAGGGADRTYRITSFSATGAALKGGIAWLDDKRALSSGTGTTAATAGADLTVNLNTIATASGVTPAADTRYTLAIDLTTLAASVQLSDVDRDVYQWGESNLKLLTAHPKLVDSVRYVVIAEIYRPTGAVDWSNATPIHRPGFTYDTVVAFFPTIRRFTTQLTSAAASNVLTHGLGGKPVVQLSYWNGAKEKVLDPESYVVDRTATQLEISTLGLTFGGGQYVEVVALFDPGAKTAAGPSNTYTSAWMSGTGTTTLAHGLTDAEDIRGYAVQEWNLTTGKRRNIDASALVKDFDGTNFYLDWSSLAPTANLQYRVVTGGSPLPWSIPTYRRYDVTFTSDPVFPLAHGLTGVPLLIAAQETASGEWEPVNLTGHVRATATQLLGSLADFFAGGATKVRLVALEAEPSTEVADATPSLAGLVKSYVPSPADSVRTISANLTITDLDGIETVLATATATVTLPTAADNEGRKLVFKNLAAAGVLTIDGEGAETIDGQATAVINTQYAFLVVLSDGAAWHIVG